MTDLEPCIGCGALFAPVEGPVHRYMDSSPACWEAFGRVLAAEYSDPDLMPVHRLSVDAYAVQHPGGDSRQAIRSVGFHLARLYLQLELSLPYDQANAAMLTLRGKKADLRRLPRPVHFTTTVADVAPAAGSTGHARAVRDWAQSAWQDWSHAHDFIRGWISV